MALLPILRWPDPLLTVPSERIEGVTAGIRNLAGDMLETMYEASGRGLAAPQVGVLQRMFVMDVGWKSGPRAPMVFVNPLILWQSGVVAMGFEGCLSIPGPLTLVQRAQAIVVQWHDLDGAPHQARMAGMAAICALHECDHLDGILTLDHLSPDARRLAQAEVQV